MGVFVALFFNTGILLTLTNANLSDVTTIGNEIFVGPFYDYSPFWYANIGNTIVKTMWINAFMPPVYEFITVAQIWIF